MSNPFNTHNTNPNFQLQNIYKMLTQSNNPMQMFRQLAATNPQMRPILNMLNGGYTPEQVFNNLCQQRGINPNEFIKNITGNNT